MQGSAETHEEITAAIAAACDQVVISVDYGLAPEHPFAAAVNDCQAVVRWSFAQAGAQGVRSNAIAIGGDSAGANLAAVMTQVSASHPSGCACRYWSTRRWTSR